MCLRELLDNLGKYKKRGTDFNITRAAVCLQPWQVACCSRGKVMPDLSPLHALEHAKQDSFTQAGIDKMTENIQARQQRLEQRKQTSHMTC